MSNKDFDWNQFEEVKPKAEEEDTEGTLQTAKDFGRGAAQSASFGFADELTGAGEAAYDVATDDKKKLKDLLDLYKKHRDESRENYKAAEERSPIAYGGGELAGALVPGIGAVGGLAKGAKLGTRLLEGAKLGSKAGALYGAGSSEGEAPGEVLQDTLKGAAAGAVTAPVIGELGIGIGKVGGKIAKNSEFVSDMLESYRRGKAGQSLAGQEAKRGTEREIDIIAKEVFNTLKNESQAAAKGKQSVLKRAEQEGLSVDVRAPLEDALGKAERLPANTKKEIKERDDLVEFIKSKLGEPEVSKEGLSDSISTKLTPRKADELEKSVSQMTNLGDESVKTSGAVKTVGKLEKDLKGQMRGEDLGKFGPELKRTDELFTASKGAQEILFPEIKGLTAEAQNRVQASFATTLRNLQKESSSGAKARLFIENAMDELAKVRPEMAASMKERLIDKATAYDLAMKIGSESLPTGELKSLIASARGGLLGTSNIGGQYVKASKDSLERVVKNGKSFIQGATPDILMDIAGKLKDSAPADLVQKLTEAANSNDNRRKAILFLIMQQPSYRQLMGISGEE